LLHRSEDLSNSWWNKQYTSVSQITVDGEIVSGIISDTTLLSYHQVFDHKKLDIDFDTEYETTVVVKAADKHNVRISVICWDSSWSGTYNAEVKVDLQLGAITYVHSNVISSSITPLDNGWFEIKFSWSVPAGTDTTNRRFCEIKPAKEDYSAYVGDGVTVDLYVRSTQVALAGKEYIKTEDTLITGYQPASTTTPNKDSAGNNLEYLPGKTMVGKKLGEEMWDGSDLESTNTTAWSPLYSDTFFNSTSKYLIVFTVEILNATSLWVFHQGGQNLITGIGNYEITSSPQGNTNLAFTPSDTGGQVKITSISVREIIEDVVNPTQLRAPLYKLHINQEKDIGVNLWFDGAGGQNALTLSDLTTNWNDANFYAANKYLIYEAAITGSCKTKTETYMAG
jgi:hypothetical protein